MIIASSTSHTMAF